MWIIDPRVGLISVVVADEPSTGKPSTDKLMLRARRPQHLQNLKRLCPMLADAKITAARKELDYPVRLVISRAVFVEAMAELARTVTYRNVKSCAHQHGVELGADFVSAMHDVHARLARIHEQPGTEPRSPDE
jgi:dihydropteroate synthase